MPGEVDRLQVKIESDAQQAFKNVDSLIGRLRELARTAGTAAYAFQRLGGGFSAMGRETKGLNSGFSEVGKQAKGMGNSLSFAEKQLAEMAAYTGATYREVARLRGGLQQYANGASAVKTSSDMASRGITSVGSAAKSAFSAIAKVGSAGFNFLGETIGSVTKRLTGFFKSIIRIAKYRAIRAALRAITDGLRVGTENLYLWSQAYNTSFAPTMDRLSTSMLYLKNGFAAMFSPLIEYFAPYIESFVDRLVDAFNWVQRLFAQLTGKTTWNKAVKVQKKYKESTDSTAKSVKALRQELQLMDFDELNNITENPDNGSPAAEAAKVEPDPTKMFTLEQTDLEPMEGTLWENIKQKLISWLEERGLWNENGFDWKRLGNIIGTWIHDLWQNFSKWWRDIDWKNDVFKPLADFLEGLLSGLFPEQYQRWQESKKAAELHNETEAMIHEINGDKNWSTGEGEESPVLQREFSQLQRDIEKLIVQRRKLISNSETVERETALKDEISAWAKSHGYENVPSPAELFADYMRGDEHAGNAYIDLPLFRAYAIGMEEANAVADKIKELQEVQSEIARKYLGKTDIEDEGGLSIGNIDLGKSINEIGERFSEMIRSSLFRDRLEQFTYEALKYVGGGIGERYRDEGEDALAEFISGVDWKNGGTATKEEIAKAFIDAGLPDEYAEIASKSASAFIEDNRWALVGEMSASSIDGALSKAGIPLWYRTNAENSIKEYLNGVDWDEPGSLSADRIKSALDNANLPEKYKAIAAESISAMLAADWRNAGVVASRNFTSGFNLGDPSMRLRSLVGSDRLVPHFAAGGYPTVGTMFVAGEAGAEFVGNINGRTGVVGGREISGIGDAVWSTGGTTANLLAELISVMKNKEFTISPSASLGKVVARSQRLYATQTG